MSPVRWLTRRQFVKGSFVGAGVLLAGKGISLAASVDDARVLAVNLRITSVTEIVHPPKRKSVKLWIPVPVSDPEQQITGFSVESRLPFQTNKTPGRDNNMLFVSAETLKPGDKVVMTYRLRRKAAGTVEEKEESPSKYLKPTEWEKWNSSLTGFVDRLVGHENDPVKIGRKVYHAIIDRMKYIHKVCGRGVSTLSFEQGLGRCDEFHALFRTMMMYKGIPVKWEQGMALPYPSEMQQTGVFEADCISAHSWVRFHIGGNRWLPVDVSEGKRRPDLRSFYFGNLAPNRIKMSSGRGLTLNPPQEGVINTFAYPYAEADGIPLIYGHNYKCVIRYELLNMEV